MDKGSYEAHIRAREPINRTSSFYIRSNDKICSKKPSRGRCFEISKEVRILYQNDGQIRVKALS